MNDKLSRRFSIGIKAHLDIAEHLKHELRREWLTVGVDRIPNLVAGLLNSAEEHLCLLFGDLLCDLFDLRVQFRSNQVGNVRQQYLEARPKLFGATFDRGCVNPVIPHVPTFMLRKPLDL